ncbi:Arylsulfatase I [Nymphon striatum]|nr:Arylsulfatase I [Nymphon striatum]
MGQTIATSFAMYGYDVNLFDVDEKRLKVVKSVIQTDLELLASEDVIKKSSIDDFLKNITVSKNLSESVNDRDYVIEAAPEILSLKQDLFRQLDELCQKQTILASNTSSLPLQEIMKNLSAERKKRALVCHWYNPGHLMPIAEISFFGNTSEAIYREVQELYESIGKQTVKVLKDVPGLVANRIQQAVAREVFSLIQNEIAAPEDIDKALKFGPAFRYATTGQLEITDFGGIDIWAIVGDNLLKKMDNSQEANPILKAKIKEGKLGFAVGLISMLFLRGVLGVFEGAYVPTAFATVKDASHPSRVGMNMGILGFGAAIAMGLAPIMATQLLPNVPSWHWVFALVSLPGLVIAYFLYKTVKDPNYTSTKEEKVKSSVKDVWKYRNIKLAVLAMCGVMACIGAEPVLLFACLFAAAALVTGSLTMLNGPIATETVQPQLIGAATGVIIGVGELPLFKGNSTAKSKKEMKNIRSLNKIYTLGFVLLFAASSLTLHAQQAKPNVVVILADDMGWNDVGYHGSEIKTPTLDRLAKQGVELNHFYVQPACSPTRSAMMTGKSSVRLGILAPLYKNSEKGLPLSETIMPQYFKQNGYQTWLVGKWHLGRFKKENWPYNRGFDHFYGNLTGGIGHYDHVHGGGLDWQRNGETIKEEGYTSHLLTKESIKLIEERKKDEPFFLELSFLAPHLPNQAPDATVAEYKHIANKKRAVHAAMVTEVDRGIQRLVEILEREGILDNTIIWFSSDNGGLNVSQEVRDNHLVVKMAEKWGRPLPLKYYEFVRTNIENGASDNSPFREGKRSIYEGGVRVPAFIYAPKLLKQQKIESRITINDLLPTLATAANFENFDYDIRDGANQWNFLTGKIEKPNIPDYITHAMNGEAYYRDNWKLILPNGKKPELYNLVKDPTEKNNIADQNLNIVSELKEALNAISRGEPVLVPMEQHSIDPDVFGGVIDRAPWASFEGRNIAKSSAKHEVQKNSSATKPKNLIYVLLLIILTLVSVILWGYFKKKRTNQ